MLSDSDIVQINVEQRVSAVDILNIFFYVIEITAVGIELLDLLLEFRDTVGVAMLDLQHSSLEQLGLQALNLTNGIDVDQIDVNNPGTDAASGPIMPTYISGGYSLNVSDRTTRNGRKALGGIGEDRVSGNNYNPATLADVELEDQLAAIQTVTGVVSGSGFMTPIVVGRDLLGDLDLDRTSIITSASSYATIRTQVSRRVAAS